MYDIDELYTARSIEDAIRALSETPGARAVAGGTDILVSIREGKLAGCSLVSIRDITELAGIECEGGVIHIGPLATFSQLAEDGMILQYIPILAEAALTVGGPQLRNMGTVGGNLANGATSADMAPALLTLNAELELRGRGGVRRVPLEQFFISAGKTVLAPDELITDITIRPEDYEGYYGCYIKFSQRMAMDIATLSCACMCRLTPDYRSIHDCRLAFGVAGPIPKRAYKTEKQITGMPAGEALNAVGRLASGDVDPRDSWRAGRGFRLALVEELSRRALNTVMIAGGRH